MIFNLDQRAEKPSDSNLIYSSYQADIFKAVSETNDNLLIEAVAGSGKTTTIIHALELLPKNEKTIFVAFNKSIADELSQKVPPSVEARTLHSVGFQILRNNFSFVKSNGKKTNNILRFEILDTKNDRALYEWCFEYSRDIDTLISRLKSALIQQASREDMIDWIDDLDLDLPTDQWAISVYQATLKRSWEFTGEKGACVIDFDDMLCLPCTLPDLEFPLYDNVIIDEAQDLNHVQRIFVSKLLRPGGRLFAVGDTNQAIYGFRGADHNSMTLIKKHMNCTEYPLSISYRCDRAIIQEAQDIVPHIESRKDAGGGLVQELEYGKHWDMYKTGDYILCRLNAPLVKEAMRLSLRGNNVCILGRDIVPGIMKIAKDVEKRYDSICLRTINDYYNEEEETIPDNKAYKKYALLDKCNVLQYICGGSHFESKHIKKVLDEIFTDRPPLGPHIKLSTIHKAKGLEADRVFILRPDYLPHPLATTAEQVQQEMNLKYVAITRAKHELYYLMENK
jgi:DNA helicase II / ATP-dependent DNA helicase PcrA